MNWGAYSDDDDESMYVCSNDKLFDKNLKFQKNQFKSTSVCDRNVNNKKKSNHHHHKTTLSALYLFIHANCTDWFCQSIN